MLLLIHLVGREIDGEVRIGRHEGNALVADFALDRRFLLEVGENLLKGVGVDAPARHILCTSIIAALDHEHCLASCCEFVGGNAACKACADDDRIEIRFLSHRVSFLSLTQPITMPQLPQAEHP